MTFSSLSGSVPAAISNALGGVASPDPKLAKLTSAAQSFEAMMLNEMLKPLHFGAGVSDGAEESEGGASDTIQGMATDALGKGLAASGGIGIARKIVKQVTAQQEATKVGQRGTKVP